MATEAEIADLADRLRAAIGDVSFRMRRRRQVPGVGGAGFSMLSRLYREGPQSQSQLATADGVQPQSLTRPLDSLETSGLVAKRPDPTDGRKLLISITPAGRQMLREDARARSEWLARALVERTDDDDRALLHDAIEVLHRIGATEIGDVPDADDRRLPLA